LLLRRFRWWQPQANNQLFQATWGGASTRDDHVIIQTRSSSAFGGPGARYVAANRADHLHSYLFNEVAPLLILMVYSCLNHRAGYRLPDKLSATTKPGVLPHVFLEHGIFTAWWQNLTIEVNRLTSDLDGVSAMMALLAHVADMMALPYGASQRDIDDAWLLAAHRILYRLDLMCHHADLAYLAREDARELPQAKLRVMAVTSMSARASSSRDAYAPRDRQIGFKRPRSGEPRGGGGRFFADRPLVYCEYHKRQVRHTAAECNLRPRASADSGK